jgi:hypothetical protein
VRGILSFAGVVATFGALLFAFNALLFEGVLLLTAGNGWGLACFAPLVAWAALAVRGQRDDFGV